MSKSKMHKQEVGKSRPTENRADNAMCQPLIQEWVEKIRVAEGKSESVTGKVDAIADVLADLLRKTQRGYYTTDVIKGVVRRGNYMCSLQKAIEKTQCRIAVR